MSRNLIINKLLIEILLVSRIKSDFVFPDNTLEKGDLCQFSETINGTCTEHCKESEDNFKNFGITPNLCSFSETIALFCCIDNERIEPQNLTNRIVDTLTKNSKNSTFYAEFDACPYNATITGICREYCPDLKFPKYKLLITEKKLCPVKRGPSLECCINHLQISYSPEIFNLSKIYEEGDFCPFNDTFIGTCENECLDRQSVNQIGTFHRQYPICNYQLDGTPIYCCNEYLYSYGKVKEVVPYAIEGDSCSFQKSKWGICKPTCTKLNIFKRSGTVPMMCPNEVEKEPLYCCPVLNQNDELDKFRNASSGRIFYKKCQEYKERHLIRQKRRIHDKIKYPVEHETGGWYIRYGSFPHMAAIGWTDSNGEIEWKCGGTLISDNFVLTAAHCTVANTVPPDAIRIGDQYLDKIEDSYNLPQDFRIEKIIKHPEYSHFSTYNDIALMKLNQSIIPTRIVHPACLWNDNDDIDDELESISTGYGSTVFGGPNSRELLYIYLKRSVHEDCVNIYKNYNIPSKLKYGILDTQLCAADPNGVQDSCQGDSGGPLEYLIDNVHYVYGITSFGHSCPSTVPGVYTKVSKYLDWIEAIVWPNKWAAMYSAI